MTRDEESTSVLPHITKSETKFSPKLRSFATLSPAPYKHNDSTYRLEFRDKSAPWSKAEDSTPLARIRQGEPQTEPVKLKNLYNSPSLNTLDVIKEPNYDAGVPSKYHEYFPIVQEKMKKDLGIWKKED